MPAKYHIHTEPARPRFRPIGKFGIVDWREDCASCHNCVKRACAYGFYREEADTLHDEIGFAAEVGARHADDGAQRRAEKRRAKADEKCRARTIDDSRQDIAAERIGAEPMRGRGRLEHRAVIGRERFVGGDNIRERRRG